MRPRHGRIALLDRLKLLQQPTVAVFNPPHQHGGQVVAAIGNGAVGRDHLDQGHGAGTQRERGHQVKLALANAHGLRELSDAGRPDLLHQLRRNGIFGIHQAVAQAGWQAARPRRIAGCPYRAALRRDGHGLVNNGVGRTKALHECSAVNKRFEGRARLTPRLTHMVKLLLRKVAAAHPGPNRTTARVQRQESGLQNGTLLPRLAPPVGQGLELRHLPGHGLSGGFLDIRVKRGMDSEAVGIDVIALVVSPGDQPLAQVLGDVRRWPQRFDLAFKVEFERSLDQFFNPGRIKFAMLGHL